MRDLNSLRIFKDVVYEGGFLAAHRKTGQSRATLSRHINELEEELNVRLIERSTRSFKLTEQGQILYKMCLSLFEQLDNTLMQVEGLQTEPSGAIRIAIPPSLINFHNLNYEIIRYMHTFPKVSIQIEVTNRQVEIQNEDFDFIIRARSNLDYPLDYVPVILAKMELCLVVHPSWKYSLNEDLHEIFKIIPCIAWKGEFEHTIWSFLNEDQKLIHLKITPRLIVDDINMLREAALNQLGIIRIPKVYVEEDLILGRLIEIDSDLKLPLSLVHAVHLGNRGMRPAVRHLLDWLKEITINLR